ncbi:MAG TPA: MarR family transcriptional regulator [Puia sp.]|nr:MarR family transcriptional regulator [Puia sp.]
MKEKQIGEIRAFNRFYTDVIGLLDRYILNSSYTLPEVRVLFEIYYQQPITASDIIASLHIDKGYLSRMILQFEKRKLLSRKRLATDGRSAQLFLTAAGKKEFEVLDRASHEQIKEILASLSEEDGDRLVQYMAGIRSILSPDKKQSAKP